MFVRWTSWISVEVAWFSLWCRYMLRARYVDLRSPTCRLLVRVVSLRRLAVPCLSPFTMVPARRLPCRFPWCTAIETSEGTGGAALARFAGSVDVYAWDGRPHRCHPRICGDACGLSLRGPSGVRSNRYRNDPAAVRRWDCHSSGWARARRVGEGIPGSGAGSVPSGPCTFAERVARAEHVRQAPMFTVTGRATNDVPHPRKGLTGRADHCERSSTSVSLCLANVFAWTTKVLHKRFRKGS